MKAYIRKLKDIKFNYMNENNIQAGMIPSMINFCGDGPFDFKKLKLHKNWFMKSGLYWHIDWLRPLTDNKQYLLDFE